MKTKTHIRKIYSIGFVVIAILFMLPTSCSKTGYTIINTTADSSNQIITAGDEQNINYEFDQAINEALLATTVSRIAGGDTAAAATGPVLYSTISNVVIDTSHIVDSALIHLTYYGKNADQTKGRTGIITLQFARDNNGKVIPWKTPGATISITFSQYEVIILATNKSLWLNGTAAITNLSGGLLKAPANIALTPGDSLQDKVSGTVVFTYNDNTTVIQTWTWDITQTRMFNLQNNLLTSTIYGDSSVQSANKISTSGTTRLGYAFYTQVTGPVVQNISSAYILSNPTAGEKVIHGIPEPVTIDYGVDIHGNPAQGISPFGYKLSWIANGGQATLVERY